MVSIDPRRVYVSSPEEIPFKTIKVRDPGMSLFYSCLLSVVKNNPSNVYLGPNGEEYVWYQCTVYVFHIYFNCMHIFSFKLSLSIISMWHISAGEFAPNSHIL